MNASKQIAYDLAKKCGEDVSAAIMRSLSLAEEQGELITIATNAVLAALTVAAGVFDGVAGQPVGTTPLRSVMDGILEVRDEYRREQPAEEAKPVEMRDLEAEVDAAAIAEYAADLEGMDDEEIKAEIISAQNELDEVEPWLEALHAEGRRRRLCV